MVCSQVLDQFSFWDDLGGLATTWVVLVGITTALQCGKGAYLVILVGRNLAAKVLPAKRDKDRYEPILGNSVEYGTAQPMCEVEPVSQVPTARH